MHNIWVNDARMQCSCGFSYDKGKRSALTPEKCAEHHADAYRPSCIRWGSYPEMRNIRAWSAQDSVLNMLGEVEGWVYWNNEHAYHGMIQPVIKDVNGNPISVIVVYGKVQVEIPWAQVSHIKINKETNNGI